jgi:hypothetical protein
VTPAWRDELDTRRSRARQSSMPHLVIAEDCCELLTGFDRALT